MAVTVLFVFLVFIFLAFQKLFISMAQFARADTGR